MLEQPFVSRWQPVGKGLEKCWNLPIGRERSQLIKAKSYETQVKGRYNKLQNC